MVPVTMGKCKTKAVQPDLGIFTHNPKYSGIFRHIQIYLDILMDIQNPV